MAAGPAWTARCSTGDGLALDLERLVCLEAGLREPLAGRIGGNDVHGRAIDPPQGIPKTVLVPTGTDDDPLYEEWLSSLRGSRVGVRVPQRGDKRELQETGTGNAKEELVRHSRRRANDHNSRAPAPNEPRTAPPDPRRTRARGRRRPAAPSTGKPGVRGSPMGKRKLG